MTRTASFFLLLFLAGPGDGEKQGRQGNAFYASEKYEEAAAAYREGLSAADAQDLPAPLRYGLQHNLGAALHRTGDLDAAREAFDRSLALAATDADVARAAYNAGNNAFAGQQLEAALDYYRKALLADPSNEDAKFNYEFARRRLQQQQQQQSGQNEQEQNQEQNQEQDQQDQQGQDEQQQNQQDQQQGEQEPQDQQGQDQQQQQNQQDQQQQQGEQEPQNSRQPDPTKMSEQQAERILQALQNEEERLLRQVQQPKTQPRRVEKDW